MFGALFKNSNDIYYIFQSVGILSDVIDRLKVRQVSTDEVSQTVALWDIRTYRSDSLFPVCKCN